MRDSMYCGVKISCDFNRLMQFSKVIDDEISFKYTGGRAGTACTVLPALCWCFMNAVVCFPSKGSGRNWRKMLTWQYA